MRTSKHPRISLNVESILGNTMRICAIGGKVQLKVEGPMRRKKESKI